MIQIKLDQTGLIDTRYYFGIIIVWLRPDRGSYILKELQPCGFLTAQLEVVVYAMLLFMLKYCARYKKEGCIIYFLQYTRLVSLLHESL